MDLEEHFQRLSTLLEAERAADRKRFEDAAARLSLRERAARGMAVAEADPVEEGGLSGRALVTYGAPAGREIDERTQPRASPLRPPASSTMSVPSGCGNKFGRSNIA